jgi:EAL domain-containing protein (putative c-di-GMP-specific phosphodiesterase class I)
VLARYVRSLGFTVTTVADGASAVALIRGGDLDAVVSDIGMPGMDGIALLRAVRAHDLDLPVILMTAAPAVETAVHAVEYGALRYLTKPVQLDALGAAIRYAVRVRQMAMLQRAAVAHLGTDGALAGDRAGLEARFALALDGLWMAYQPLVAWREQRVFAYEALLRSAEASLPAPGVLLETAERLGQLARLGNAVRSRVSEDVGDAVEPALVFVNLHPADLLDDRLYSSAHPFSRHATRMVLEITERMALGGVPNVRERATRLRAMGFRLAVDDLGAGFAGLSSVVQLEPEFIKFDMALVRDIHREPTKQRLVRSMMALCRDMEVVGVAEGVETTAERDTLLELGCDVLQGYLFARPAPGFGEPVWDATP